MAMPASGQIGLLNCITGINCSSISFAVTGNNTPPKTLSALSICAGKTAPYSMTKFYGYTNVFKQVGFCNISRVGTNGVSSTVCSLDCICSNTAMVAGQCYTITLCHQICSNSCTGSRACVQVCGAANYCCVVSNGQVGASFSCSFVVSQGQAICMINLASHGLAGGTPVSCARTCITSIAPTMGLFCKTTGCSDCTVWSC